MKKRLTIRLVKCIIRLLTGRRIKEFDGRPAGYYQISIGNVAVILSKDTISDYRYHAHLRMLILVLNDET